jgi:NADPH:quinone reductase-like Zn-dependent oxidoreductase/acyl carrier protein
LHLIQGLAQHPDMQTQGLFIVTCQAEPDHPGNGSMAPMQAPMVGLLRVTANEYPELRCRVIDLDGAAHSLALLAAELLSDSREEEVVLAGGERYVHRLVRSSLHEAVEPGGQATRRKPPRSEVGMTRLAPIAHGADITAALPDAMPSLPALIGSWYALHHHARVQAGENVLIHGADDPVGLAAVHVARGVGARIHATTRGADWRDRLRSLGVEEVFDWNCLESIDSLRDKVAGGFDIVLNTLSGEPAQKAFTLLAPFGRLLDVKHAEDTQLEVGPLLRPNQSVTRVNVEDLLRRRPELSEQLLSGVREHFRAADCVPLPEGLAALSLDENGAAVASNRSRSTELFQAEGTYLITGGFGGFGLEVAKWMVAQGARHLVLVGRRGANTPQAQAAMAELATAGAHVRPVAADVSLEADVKRLLGDIAQDMPPLKGLFHAAAVLDDGPINSTDAVRVANVMGPKALGAWYLHCHTLDMPLEHFVLFSSMASLLGSPGQVTYVVANAFLDALAHYRRALKLPGISINWGALGEVGMAARYEGVEKYFNRVGIGSFAPSQAVKVCGEILRSNPVQIGAIMIDWQLWGEFTPAWAASPRYHGLMAEGVTGEVGTAEDGLLHRLRQLPADKRGNVIAKAMTDLIAETLQLPSEEIDHSRSLLNMGVDSLMAIELQTAIEQRIGVRVSALELMKGTSLAQLVRHMSTHIGSAEAEKAPVITTPETDQVMARVEELSDQQVDELLAELADQDQEEFGA